VGNRQRRAFYERGGPIGTQANQGVHKDARRNPDLCSTWLEKGPQGLGISKPNWTRKKKEKAKKSGMTLKPRENGIEGVYSLEQGGGNLGAIGDPRKRMGECQRGGKLALWGQGVDALKLQGQLNVVRTKTAIPNVPEVKEFPQCNTGECVGQSRLRSLV